MIDRCLNTVGKVVNFGNGLGNYPSIDDLVSQGSLAYLPFDERQTNGAIKREH
jgi:hypothetical protein